MLFRGITSKYNGDFYCLDCFSSFRTENALKNHEETIIIVTYKCLMKKIIY